MAQPQCLPNLGFVEKEKKEIEYVFTLLSSPKRLRLRNRVGCLAIDLEMKLFFVHLMVSLPCVRCWASFLGQRSERAGATEPETRVQLMWLEAVRLGGGQ